MWCCCHGQAWAAARPFLGATVFGTTLNRRCRALASCSVPVQGSALGSRSCGCVGNRWGGCAGKAVAASLSSRPIRDWWPRCWSWSSTTRRGDPRSRRCSGRPSRPAIRPRDPRVLREHDPLCRRVVGIERYLGATYLMISAYGGDSNGYRTQHLNTELAGLAAESVWPSRSANCHQQVDQDRAPALLRSLDELVGRRWIGHGSWSAPSPQAPPASA